MQEIERNTRLVIDHFEDFVNRHDLTAIDPNMTLDFLDHDGPGGREVDRDADCVMMAKMHELFIDLRVEVRDSVAQGDKVVVRNVWTCTNAKTGKRVESHGLSCGALLTERSRSAGRRSRRCRS